MFKDIILENYFKYPKLQIQDIIKLIYQSSFGCEHLLIDKQLSYQKFCKEWESIIPKQTELLSDIGNGYCRINLKHSKAIGLDKDLIFKIFCLSSEKCKMENKIFYQEIEILKRMCEKNMLRFSTDEIDEFLSKWISDGCRPVSHTSVYKENYHPSYRVVLKQYADYIILFDDIKKSNDNITVGIDGKCGSGKSTLGKMLKKVFECNLFHADDFFLPPEKRTPQRLSQAGENFDYERFNNEIIKGIKSLKPFKYSPFSCSRMSLKEPIYVTPTKVTVVEGSYCMHPYLDDIYDIKVFLDIDNESQIKRIFQRDGKEKLNDFVEKWIPMENNYFSSFSIKDKCDYCFNVE